MTRYILTGPAQRDLQEILFYIADHDGETRADAILARFIQAFELLAHSPRIGTLRPTTPNLRWWSVVPFYIVYDPAAEPMHIHRILHAARDLSDLFE